MFLGKYVDNLPDLIFPIERPNFDQYTDPSVSHFLHNLSISLRCFDLALIIVLLIGNLTIYQKVYKMIDYVIVEFLFKK